MPQSRAFSHPLTADHTGVTGGVVIWRRKNRMNVRARMSEVIRPRKILTTSQITFRAVDAQYRLCSLDQVWRWNGRGIRYKRTGYQEFMRVNLRRVFAGGSVILDPGSYPARPNRYDWVR